MYSQKNILLFKNRIRGGYLKYFNKTKLLRLVLWSRGAEIQLDCWLEFTRENGEQDWL